MEEYLDFFIDHINQASVCLGVLAFIVTLILNLIRKQRPILEDLIVRVISASAFPTASALLICSFFPKYLAQLAGLHIHIASAGLCLFYLAWKGVTRKREASDEASA